MAPSNELFQYSVVSALMDGVAGSGLPLAELVARGDHGLGTFRHMVGEMVVLDGRIFQMKSDGSVSAVADEAAVTPFAMVTRFEPTVRARAALADKQALAELLSQLLPGTRNHYLAFRIDGLFRSVTVRTVGGQTVPHEPLAELGKHQVSHSLSNVRGTVIGFRSPAFLQGVSVAGDHLHFITADRSRGGHLLACETEGDVDVAAAPIWTIHLELPRADAEFNDARLEADGEGIASVEG